MKVTVENRIPALLFVKIIQRASGDLVVDISSGLPNRVLAGSTMVSAMDSAEIEPEKIDV